MRVLIQFDWTLMTFVLLSNRGVHIIKGQPVQLLVWDISVVYIKQHAFMIEMNIGTYTVWFCWLLVVSNMFHQPLTIDQQ